MKKKEWDKKLLKALKKLPKDECGRIMSYYDEIYADMTESGVSESEAVASFGEPETVAKKIMSDYNAYLERDESDITPASEADFTQGEDVSAESESAAAVNRAPSSGEGEYAGYEIYENENVYSRVRKLNLETSASNVTVRRAPKFRLMLKSDSDTRFTVQPTGDTLYVKERGTTVLKKIGIGLKEKEMIIEMPALDEATFLSSRNFSVSGFTVARLSLRSTNGDISVEACDTESLSLSAVNGKISLKGGCHNGATVNVGCGEARVENAELKSLDVSTATGDVCLDNVTVATSANIRTVGGKILCDGLKGDAVECKTLTGDCRLHLYGNPEDCKIDVSAATGKVHAPSGGASGRRIRARTFSGEVEITFDK